MTPEEQTKIARLIRNTICACVVHKTEKSEIFAALRRLDPDFLFAINQAEAEGEQAAMGLYAEIFGKGEEFWESLKEAGRVDPSRKSKRGEK